MSNRPRIKEDKPSRVVVTDIDAILAEATYEPYGFTLKGRECELPHLRMLKLAQVRALDAGKFEDVLNEVASDYADDILDLPSFALDKVVESWLAHGGVDLGELLASANS